MQTLTNKINTSILKFENESTNYAAKFNNNCDMVARFDEVMTQKANKIQVDELFKEFKIQNDVKIQGVKDMLTEAQKERNKYTASFNQFAHLLQDQVYSSVKAVMK